MNHNLRLLRLHNICIGFLPGSAIFILYFSEVAGSVTGGAAVFAVSMLVAAVFELPTGAFSDRVGRKPAAIVGTCSVAIGLVLLAVATDPIVLFIGAVFDGIGMAMWAGNTAALLYDTLAEEGETERFGKEFGRLQGCYHWSSAVAGIVGGALAFHSLQWAVWASVPMHVVAIFVAMRLREPARSSERSASVRGHFVETVRAVSSNRRLALLVTGSVLATGFSMTSFVLRATWSATLWPIWAVSAARSAGGVFAAIGTWWGHVFIRRFGAGGAVVASRGVSGAANLAALAVPTIASPGVMTGSSLAFGIATTADNVLLQEHFPDSQRATLGSLVSLGGRLVFAAAVLALGVVADTAGPGVALALTEVMLLLSLPFYAAVMGLRHRAMRAARPAV